MAAYGDYHKQAQGNCMNQTLGLAEKNAPKTIVRLRKSAIFEVTEIQLLSVPKDDKRAGKPCQEFSS